MNETEIKDIIHNCYLKILKRVPDLEGLNYYLELMKSGKINKEKLEQVLKKSDGFLGYKQIKKSSLKKLENNSQTKIPKIVAMYRIQNEERWIEKSLESVSEICQEIVILDDCSTDNTLKICKQFSNVIDIYERKEPLPLDEVRDRNILLQMALKRNPEYILSLDGDEILAPHSKEILSEELNVLYPENSVFTFQVLYVWDKPNQIRSDGFFQSVWRSRLYKMKSQPHDLHYENSIFRGNLHCNSIPDNTIGIDKPLSSNVKILHYGYYDKELRTRKYNWAESYKLAISEQDINQYLISGKGPRSGPNGIELQNLPNSLHVGEI